MFFKSFFFKCTLFAAWKQAKPLREYCIAAYEIAKSFAKNSFLYLIFILISYNWELPSIFALSLLD